jgi:hypothetical protein
MTAGSEPVMLPSGAGNPEHLLGVERLFQEIDELACAGGDEVKRNRVVSFRNWFDCHCDSRHFDIFIPIQGIAYRE